MFSITIVRHTYAAVVHWIMQNLFMCRCVAHIILNSPATRGRETPVCDQRVLLMKFTAAAFVRWNWIIASQWVSSAIAANAVRFRHGVSITITTLCRLSITEKRKNVSNFVCNCIYASKTTARVQLTWPFMRRGGTLSLLWNSPPCSSRSCSIHCQSY